MLLVRLVDGQIVENGCEHDFPGMVKRMTQEPQSFNLIALVDHSDRKVPNEIPTLIPVLGYADRKQIAF